MPYLIITNINIHYRHYQFNEIAKLIDLDVLFTIKKLPNNRFKFKQNSKLYKSITIFRALKRLNEYEKILVLENGKQTLLFVLLFGFLSLFIKAKMIIWIGNNSRSELPFKKAFFYYCYYTLLSLFYDRAIFYSESSKEFYEKYNKGRLLKKCIISGQQYPFYEEYKTLPSCNVIIPSFDQRTLKLLFIGQDIPRKGLIDIIDSVNKIHNLRKGGVAITLVGGNFSEVRSKLICQITCLDFANSEAKKRLFKQHDFLILPTRHEPWGHIIVEALGFGILPIMSDKTGAYGVLEKYYGIDRKYYLWKRDLDNLPNIITNLGTLAKQEFKLHKDGAELLFDIKKFSSDLICL